VRKERQAREKARKVEKAAANCSGQSGVIINTIMHGENHVSTVRGREWGGIGNKTEGEIIEHDGEICYP
jgi:hypothetical protein